MDYIPPFRGRAIHVLRRDADFDSLNVDFAELNKRKQSEYEKLDQMIRYVHSHRCRQLEILEYFGDSQRQVCRCCDNCGLGTSSAGKSDVARMDDRKLQRLWYAILVVLSGAARTHGRIGKQLLVQLLTGSDSKKLKRLRLERIPTFGRLRQLTQALVDQLVSELLQGGWLTQIENTRFRPVIQISDAGRRLVKQSLQPDVIAALPMELVNIIARELTEIETAEKVKSTKADPRTSTPSNSTDPSAAVSVPKIATFDEPGQSSDEPSPSPSSRNAPASPAAVSGKAPTQQPSENVGPSGKPSYYWTWRLFQQGYSATEVQEVRGIERCQIVDHLTAAADAALPVQAEWLLTAEQIRALEKLMGQTSGDSLVHRPSTAAPHHASGDDVLFEVSSAATNSFELTTDAFQ